MGRILVVTTGGCEKTASRLLARGAMERGEIFSEAFPDGEMHHGLAKPPGKGELSPTVLLEPAGRDVIVVGDFESADSTLELFDVASLLAEEGALGLTLVVPGEKPGAPLGKHESFMRRVMTRMLSAIPDTPLGNRIVPVDMTSPAMPFYDDRGIKPNNKVPRGLRGRAAIELFADRGKRILFASKSYGYMLEEFLALADLEKGEVERDETTGAFKKVHSEVFGRDVVVVGGTINHDETLDIYVLANALFEAGALSLTLVIPYFGYSTMERGKPELHEAVKAAYRARLLSSIPRCPLGNQVILCDLHADGIPYYFQNGMRATHCYAIKKVILAAAKGLRNGRICTTDAGRGKWAESLVKDINGALEAQGCPVEDLWQTAIAIKDRKSGSETKLIGVLGDVDGRDIELFDDMIRRGTTAIDAGKGYRKGKAVDLDAIPAELLHEYKELLAKVRAARGKGGCKQIRFRASHGVLPGNALERLEQAVDDEGRPLFSEVVVLNTHPQAVRLEGSFLKVESSSPMLIEHLNTLFPVTSLTSPR